MGRDDMKAQFLPHPDDAQRTLLSIVVRPLDAELAGGDTPGLNRTLRRLFQIEADLLAPHWTLGIDDDDQLVLGIDLPLDECRPEALPLRLGQGFDLGQTLNEMWETLAAEPE